MATPTSFFCHEKTFSVAHHATSMPSTLDTNHSLYNSVIELCIMKSKLVSRFFVVALSSVTAFVLDQPCHHHRRMPFRTSMVVVDEDVILQARTMPVQIVSEMPPPLPQNTKNQYYFLRHGQSTANVASIISSDRSLAYSDKHGLTALGYEQGKESAQQLLGRLEADGAKEGDKVIFVSSPFARAMQTAEACLAGLTEQPNRVRVESMGLDISNEIVVEHRLMERYFGKLDGEAIYTYAYVWPVDKMNVTHTAFQVESVAAVCTRLLEVMNRCESEYQNCHIVWVSHADVLQIGQLYAAGAENVGDFSSYRFKNGEVRAMKRSKEYLPEPSPLEAPDRRLKTSL
jgi:broad specificity phosphatase PhoE